MPVLPSSTAEFDIGLAFWHWVKDNPEIPIIITEGGKKAGCLLSQGKVTIALPGITMWRKDEELLPELKILANDGRHLSLIHI